MAAASGQEPLRATIWNEFAHERERAEVRARFRGAILAEPEHGLLENAVAERVARHVLEGMGLVILHSAHLCKPVRRLMGTSCNLRWREADDRELVWTIARLHPIAAGVPWPLVIERTCRRTDAVRDTVYSPAGWFER